MSVHGCTSVYISVHWYKWVYMNVDSDGKINLLAPQSVVAVCHLSKPI